MEQLIAAQTGACFDMKTGQTITVTDVEGGQVADFFAQSAIDQNEYFSAAVTIDCHESLALHVGDELLTNLYRPMFELIHDDVGAHDLLFPCCRPQMYDYFYGNGKGHPNCFDNINRTLGSNRTLIQPLNLFMRTKVEAGGRIVILPPLSRPGDSTTLRALMDARVAIAACSVSEGECNDHECTAIRVRIE